MTARSLDEAIFDLDLDELDNKITGRELWTSLHAELGDAGLWRMTHIINDLLNNTRMSTVTPVNLYRNPALFYGRTIQLGDKIGVFTDIVRVGVGDSGEFHLVIDGSIYKEKYDKLMKLHPVADNLESPGCVGWATVSLPNGATVKHHCSKGRGHSGDHTPDMRSLGFDQVSKFNTPTGEGLYPGTKDAGYIVQPVYDLARDRQKYYGRTVFLNRVLVKGVLTDIGSYPPDYKKKAFVVDGKIYIMNDGDIVTIYDKEN